MHHLRQTLWAALLLVTLAPVRADVAVLIHGYLGSAASWQLSGITSQLAGADWQDAGVLVAGPQGVSLQGRPAPAENRFYRIELPSTAPAMLQAQVLIQALDRVARDNPKQAVTLVGHSAGGVVARLALVLQPRSEVVRLISIAAPQLGTDRALQALQASDDSGMFGFVKEWFVRRKIGDGMYDTLQLSRGILMDLAPAYPGSLLGWLNQQRHPEIEYVSVIRSSPVPIAGDLLVPPFSQDLNQVPSLRGRSSVKLLATGHELTPGDGQLLVKLL